MAGQPGAHAADLGAELQLGCLESGWLRLPGCVLEVRDAQTGRALDPAAGYGVTVNSYLADGGDEFSVLLEGTDRVGGPLDLEGLVRWMPGQPQPLRAPAVGQRIKRLN